MADEVITVEWISTAQQMLTTIQKVDAKLERQEKVMQKLTDTSKKGAEAAAGSFNKLEGELKDGEAALKKLTMGTQAFADQKAKVDALRESVNGAKTALGSMAAEQAGAANVVDQFTSAIGGTVTTFLSIGAIVQSLKTDLENLARKRENERLAEVDFGTALAARTISNLPENERAAVRPLALNVADEIGANPGAVVEAIGELRSTGAQDLLEAATFLREAANAFPQDLAAAKGIARAALIEAGATGNRDAKQVIGGTIAAQSVSLTKSPEEFAKAFGSNIASSVSVYKQTPERAREEAAIFSLLETRGADVAADAQRSFYTQISKFVPEQSATLKSGEKVAVQADAIKSFMDADFTSRQQMLEQDDNLRKQFIEKLQETGRTAIIRRLQPTNEDRTIIETAQQGIGSDAQGAQMLAAQQQQAGVAAAFAISQGQREAQKLTAEIRSDLKEKLTAELEQTQAGIVERTRAGAGGTLQSSFEAFGTYVEQLMSGESRGQVLENTVQFRANTEADPRNREFVQQQLQRITELKTQIEALDETNKRGGVELKRMEDNQLQAKAVDIQVAQDNVNPERPVIAQNPAVGNDRLLAAMEEQNRLIREQNLMMQQQQSKPVEKQQQRVPQPAVRPKEAPLPAATAP
jgi:hypothetical protein